jgi:signal transduction histidine kinase/ligand-binding sensor domain-containing protein
MRYLIIACLIFFNSFHTSGQQLFVQDYSNEFYEGGSQNWSVRQDKNNIFYVANNEGVLTYDGVKWDLFSLPNKEAIYSVAIDSIGKIYICSDNELGYFQRRSDGKYDYHSLLAMLPDSCKQPLRISMVKVFDNKAFFENDRNIYIYINDHFKIFAIHNDGLISSQNNLYLERDNALFRYRNEEFETVPYFKEVKGIRHSWITDYVPGSYLILDDKNQVWLVNEKYPDQCTIFSEELNRNLKGLKIQSIASLDNGNIAIHIGKGILFFSKEGKLLYSIFKENLMKWGFLLEDKQHNLWANADSDIYQIITSSPLSYYDKENGLTGFVVCFGKKGNHQYVGTDKGIFYHENRASFTHLSETESYIWNFYNFHNKLYAVGSYIMEIQGKKVTKIIKHKAEYHSLCEVNNRPDRMLAGTNAGILLLQKRGTIWNRKKIEGFDEETRFMQQDEEGNIWVSHANKGIWKLCLNDQMDSVISHTFYGRNEGLPSNINNRICRLREKIIVTTVDGIYSYNRNSKQFERQEEFGKVLGNNFCIYSITEGAGGDVYFWGASPQKKETAGLLKKQADGSFKLLLTPFNKTSVFFQNPRVDVDAPLLVTNSGEVWIGNNLKILNYNPEQKYFYNDSIQLSIKKVWARDSLIYQNPSRKEIHTLPFALNNFRLEFFCSFFENPEKTKYQYKMDGFENKWSDWTFNKEAFFTNLPEGDYTFYVRAKNIYDVLSQPASFSFHINPPWYRTWMAYLLYLISFISLLYLIVQLNIKRVNRQKIALEGIVKEKTRELINANEELLDQSNLLSKQNHQLQKAQITIENKNKEIKHRNETLEEEVDKRTEELMQYNQQLEQFAFVTAHNLRGPVARILGLGNVLELTENVPDEVKTITDKLIFTAEEIDSVITDLNQILQIRNMPSPLEELDLKKETSKIISNLEKEINSSNAIVRTDFPEIRSVITSKIYLDSILYNLLSNSIKFRHPERTPDIKITAINENDYICLVVSDNGLGIDLQKNRNKLFKLYSRFHFHIEGKGLGLYLTKTKVLTLGGKIEVKSEVNIGTTFKVFFKRMDVFDSSLTCR